MSSAEGKLPCVGPKAGFGALGLDLLRQLSATKYRDR